MRGRISIGLITLLPFLIGSCSDETTEPDTSGTGIEGGVVTSASDEATVFIPSGAISSGRVDVTVTDRGIAGFPDPAGRWSSVFEFEPDGQSFDLPVTISLVLPDSLADSTATLWTLNQTTNQWDEIPLSHTFGGRVWGQTSGFSWYSAGPAAIPDGCNFREMINIRTPGNVEVLIANQEAQFLIGAGTLFEQETGSKWITLTNTFTVQGIAGPPAGTGKWIDFATGPQFQTGEFAIAADGTFSFDLDIPQLGFRYLGLTDACLAPVATPENGWYYNLEVYCGADCPSSGGTVSDCQFPSTVRMENTGFNWVEASFSFLEDQVCSLDLSAVTNPITRVIRFQYSATSSSIGRNARSIQGAKRWDILSTSAGTLIQGQLVNSLPDNTDITFDLKDADDMQAPSYRLIFRFDGDDVTIKSFVEL